MMRIHVMMYENVMFLAGENKSRIAVGEMNLSFPREKVDEGDREQQPSGEDNSVGE